VKKLYAITMGKRYRGPAEGSFGLPDGRQVEMSKFAAKGTRLYAYAEVRCTEEGAARFAADTGLSIEPIKESALGEHPFAQPLEPISDAEAKAIKEENRAAGSGGKKKG
jgi:hypothetical protein